MSFNKQSRELKEGGEYIWWCGSSLDDWEQVWESGDH